MFLLWLLFRCLALGLPTVLQYDSSHALLFHKDGVSALKELQDFSVYGPLSYLDLGYSGRIWALVDIDQNHPHPTGTFMYNTQFFVVSAISPHSGSGRINWLCKQYTERFYMEPWDFSQVLQVYVNKPSAEGLQFSRSRPAAACQGHSSLDAPSELNPPQRIPSPLLLHY